MLTVQEIRKNLREIQYYYSKQKTFERSSATIGQSTVLEIVERYNKAIRGAPVRMYDLYISLYVNNNTQESLAYDWNYSLDYIKRLNKKLCEFFQKTFV